MTEPIGFIGVGAMGSAIASRLLAKHELWVSDRRRAAADDLVAGGATFAPAEEVGERCRVVFLCLPGPAQVRELLLGEGGLAPHLETGTVVIDITTSTPVVDDEIVAELARYGVSYADSPIGGGVRRARDGTATLMVGADDEVFALIADVLRDVTPTVLHVGPVGAGHAMKLVNNLMNSCHRFVALEAIHLARACGIPQATVVDVLNQSTGRSYVTEYSYTQLVEGDDWLPQGFTLELMRKDLALANELADSLRRSTPIGHLAQDFLDAAIERFGADADQSTLMAEWASTPQ